MRLLVDAKCLQTNSRYRGIGRYSDNLLRPLLPGLTDAGIDVRLLADRTLPAPALTEEGVPTIWFDSTGLDDLHGYPTLIHARILGASADAVFVPSPFEWGTFPAYADLPLPLFTVCYDLIPLIYKDRYLTAGEYPTRYQRDADAVAKSEHIFAISECTRQDTIQRLDVAPERVTNILAGVGPEFVPLDERERRQWSGTIAAKFGLKAGAFVLYQGGEDWRKNLEGAIEGFARVPASVRAGSKLAIVCKIREETAAQLTALARNHGVGGDVVFTGFVSDEELRALYGLCQLFFFPSHYEGFGLPVVEAMSCGAAVCVGDNSSLRELVDDPNLRFDTTSPSAIGACLTRLLSDRTLLEAESLAGPERASRFSWERAAESVARTLASWKPDGCGVRRSAAGTRLVASERLRLGVVTPLPPSRSGISDYSVDLAPALDECAEVTYFHDAADRQEGSPVARPESELIESAEKLDAVLYHMGNSAFHTGMYALLKRLPGFTVLHDYAVTGMLWHVEQTALPLGWKFSDELSHQYGSTEAGAVERRLRAKEWDIAELPTHGYYGNRRIFSRSLGVVLHSRWARDKARADHGDDCPLLLLPMPMPLEAPVSRDGVRESRRRLGLPESDFVIVAPGFVHAVKRPFATLHAFARIAASRPDATLVFAGSTEYLLEDLHGEIRSLGLEKRVRVTDYLTMDAFREYIRAADLCINLRYPSNGETSASVLRIMAQGKPVIVTAIDSFLDYPDDVALKVPPPTEGDEVEVTAALFERLAASPDELQALGERARAYVAEHHDPVRVARSLTDFVRETLATPRAKLLVAADAAARRAALAAVHGSDGDALLERCLSGLLGRE